MLINKFNRSPAGEGGGGAGAESGASAGGGNNGAGDNNASHSASSQQTTPSAGDTSTTTSGNDADIKDPAAYWKAQAEKFERLHQKATEHTQSIEERLKALGGDVEKSAKADLQKLQEELQKERDEIASTRRELDQRKAAQDAGIPASLAARLQGSTYDEMLADAKALAEIVPAGGGSGTSSAGRDGAPASGSALTMDMIRKMSPGEIRARQSEVDAVLSGK